MTILLVEDDAMIRGLLTRLLVNGGYDVLAAATGEEAQALAAARLPGIDLLVCDVCLPGVSGPQLARQLTGLHPGLRILLMSGDPALDVLTEDASVDAAFLSKPFTTKAFIDSVQQRLADCGTRPRGALFDSPRAFVEN